MIYRVIKCEIDLATMRSDVRSEGQMTEKCRIVLNCVTKCNGSGIVSQDPSWHLQNSAGTVLNG